MLCLYSERNDFTGFENAAFIAWKPTVIKAIANAASPANKNVSQFISIL